MSQFSRRIRWLQFLFPQSVAPRAQDPGQLSDDVSLVQNYDGGAYGISALEQPDWWTFLILATAAAGDEVVFSVPEGFIFRFMRGDYFLRAGNAPFGRFDIQSDTFGTISATEETRDATVGPLNTLGGPVLTPIVPPGADIRFSYHGGNASTDILARIYGSLAPLGSVHHI